MPHADIEDADAVPAPAHAEEAVAPAAPGENVPAPEREEPAPVPATPAPEGVPAAEKEDRFSALLRLLDAPAAVPAGTPPEPAEAAPAAVPAEPETVKFLREKRLAGISLEEALRTVRAAGADVPSAAFDWENPKAETAKMRERKFSVAKTLGEIFPKTRGALDRAAGKIAASKWSPRWQTAAEKAVRDFLRAAEGLGEAAADFSAASGLLPETGTLVALKDFLRLAETLLAVRGEDARLVLGPAAEKELALLREAVSLAESRTRHEKLLSLPYPKTAAADARLDAWLALWNEAEVDRAFPRWRNRRKVVKALRELAGGTKEKPLDPRVDLGNLIALRVSRKEFDEKFSALAAANPTFFGGSVPAAGTRSAAERLAALEKARAGTAAAFARLENVPEKLDAWRSVIARWLGGTEPAFAPGGRIETAFAATKSAAANFEEARRALFDATGTAFPADAGGADAAGVADAVDFAREMLADAELWREVCAWNAAALSAERRGMGALAADVRSGALPAEKAFAAFELAYCRRWAEALLAEMPAPEGVPAPAPET